MNFDRKIFANKSNSLGNSKSPSLCEDAFFRLIPIQFITQGTKVPEGTRQVRLEGQTDRTQVRKACVSWQRLRSAGMEEAEAE